VCPCGLTIPACTLNEMNGDREPVLLCPVKIACGIFAPEILPDAARDLVGGAKAGKDVHERTGSHL